MCTDAPDNSNAASDEFLLCTPAAGVAPGTAISTAPPLTLWNPGDSLYFLDIVGALASYVSGTLGAGSVVLALHKQAANIVGGTPLFPVNALDRGGLPPRVTGNSGGTIENTPTLVRPVFQQGAFTAASAWPIIPADQMPVRLTLSPGWAATLHGVAAAGVSPLMLLGLAFKLRPVKQ